jgi:hypothetical protein
MAATLAPLSLRSDIPPTVPKGDELFPAWFPDSGVHRLRHQRRWSDGHLHRQLAAVRPLQIQQRTFRFEGRSGAVSVAPSGAEIAFEQNNQIYLAGSWIRALSAN